MIQPLNALPCGTSDVLDVHSTLGQLGWQLGDIGLPVGAPPNALADYRRPGRAALLCRDTSGELILAEYVESGHAVA